VVELEERVAVSLLHGADDGEHDLCIGHDELRSLRAYVGIRVAGHYRGFVLKPPVRIRRASPSAERTTSRILGSG
jgi:hypothetical protein